MKLESVRPMNFSGIPFVLVVVSFVLLIVLPRLVSHVQGIFFVIGVFCLMASWGTGAEVEGNSIVLKYVFGKLKIRIPFDDIEEITTLNRLQKGAIAGYFKWEILLFIVFIAYALFDLITLPRGLLKGYYFGDIGLIVFGLFYIFAFVIPFSRKVFVAILAYSFVPVAIFLLYQKTGSITGDDIFMFIALVMVLGFAILDIYGKDYVLIRTKKNTYLLTCRSADEIVKALLKVAQNVQAP
ncbi:hypothetical protein [Thermococcus barophilus]|uniref:Hypothetical membrane protein n=1 Tax=Thermococcus barophilus (strain DSM 11836 / MP) TaxID=391623 RepID=F0LK85_THEBM|nr:hypothetical protein [Thermococcus barophilus]ADT84797.1 hypothetical membrane protein [Thermococcus barophilus MP]